jgi:DNA-binding sugar fermentation-stimulating protein
MKNIASLYDTDPLFLLDLGPLVSGILVKRPSATVKSPYIADVLLADNTTVQAWAPALDVGGLCSPGCKVLMKERAPGGKSSHSIELVYCTGVECGESGEVLIGANPRLGEDLARIVLERGLIEGLGGTDVEVKGQVKLGDSRVDFLLHGSYVVEVKNVVCADYCQSTAPVKRSVNHCVVVNPKPFAEYSRAGLFPWGKLGQEFEGRKVVSERAIKHVRNLSSLLRNKTNEVKSATVMFVLNRGDCKTMRACGEQDSMFAEELDKAREEGVDAKCFKVRWEESGRCYFEGAVDVEYWRKR